MESANDRSDNPYTQLEGYRVYDASGEEVGRIDDTVYDAPSDVLKYVAGFQHAAPFGLRLSAFQLVSTLGPSGFACQLVVFVDRIRYAWPIGIFPG
jgi:hypothetical protein